MADLFLISVHKYADHKLPFDSNIDLFQTQSMTQDHTQFIPFFFLSKTKIFPHSWWDLENVQMVVM